jgi:hypothetical protein
MFSLNSFSQKSTISRSLAAVSVGAITAQLCAQWVTLCGGTSVSLMALMAGIATGVFASHWAGSLIPFYNTVGRRRKSPKYWLAIALVLLCWVTPECLNATLLAGAETLGGGRSASGLFALLFPAAFVALIWAIAAVYFQSIVAREEGTWIASFMTGSLGVSLLMIHCWVQMPLSVMSIVTVIVSLAACIALDTLQFDDLPDSPAEEGPKRSLLLPLHFFAAGMLLVAVTEAMARILALSLPILSLTIGMTGMALLMLSSNASVRLLRSAGLNSFSLLILALYPMMFASLGELNLWAGINLESPITEFVVRALQCAVLLTAALLPAVLNGKSDRSTSGSQTALFSATAGLVLGLAIINRGFSPVLLLVLGIVMHAAGVFRSIRSGNQDRVWKMPLGGSRSLPLHASFGLLLIPVCAFFGGVDSARVSSMIFSPRTLAAIERGVDKELIAESDANRLIVTSSGASGEFSVWRRSAQVVEFQCNGVSLGRVSTNTNISPQPSEDVLPAIFGMVSHQQPSRVMILGDDTGVCLRTCSHFPVQEIVCIRSDARLTKLASQFTWSADEFPADKDSRVRIMHTAQNIAMRDRSLEKFDVVIAASESLAVLSGACKFTREFYAAAKSRMTPDGFFCQRFRQQDLGPEPIRTVMGTLLREFQQVGAIQTIPGEIVLLATNDPDGLVDPQILKRLQRDHVRQEIAVTGMDWSQLAVLPLVDARDPIGIFSKDSLPAAASLTTGGFAMSGPFEKARTGMKNEETRLAFGPHQIQYLAAIPVTEDNEEVKRRLTALAQQTEILAGMPDQPWTYRKSLRMEMQRSPRPPLEVIEDGEVVKTAHPLDAFSRDYFQTLGNSLAALSNASSPASEAIKPLERFTETPEPLLSHFAHYEIIRLHELAKHPAPADEFRHRLHIVFYTSPSDASVRPVISALEQLVNQPTLIADSTERYDTLNSLVQKLIERWEARTAWEPRSATRVQNDVDQSVRITNLALDQMEVLASDASVPGTDFLRRRRYINAALIGPLRDYRDQVLAHRRKTEIPAEPDSEDPNDMPLLLNSEATLHSN